WLRKPFIALETRCQVIGGLALGNFPVPSLRHPTGWSALCPWTALHRQAATIARQHKKIPHADRGRCIADFRGPEVSKIAVKAVLKNGFPPRFLPPRGGFLLSENAVAFRAE